MTTVRKPTGRAKAMPTGLAIGTGISLGVTLVLSLLGAKLMDMGTLKEAAIGYWVMGILLSASFSGAVTAGKTIRRQYLAVCGIASGIYYLCLLSMTALLFGGQYQGMGVTALMVLCGGTLAAVTMTRQGRGGKKHLRYKKRYR